MLSGRRVPSVLRTSGMSGPPSVIRVSPLLRGVTLGYQRPAYMLGPRLQVLVLGSKMWVFSSPWSCWSLFPPAMKIEPSIRWARPLQKMLKPVVTFTGVCVPVLGSQTVARLWSCTG